MQAALGIALLFLWMKCWQAVANGIWRDCRANQPSAPWTAQRIMRLIILQCAVQPTGLFLRLLAANLAVPYVWTYNFYQGFGVFGDGTTASLRAVARRSWSQARWRPAQAHAALTHLFLFAFFVWLNVMSFFFVAPQLLHIFTGIETAFTRTPTAMLNSTVFAASLAVTYLCFDPLRKALSVLRCFYAEAEQTAEDLRVELQTLRLASAGKVALAAVAALLLLHFNAPCTLAAEPVPAQAAQLDGSIERTLQHREYAWRLPLEESAAAERGAAERFLDELRRTVAHTLAKVSRWIGDFFGRQDTRGSGAGWGNLNFASRGLLYTVIGLSAAVIGFFLWKQRRNFRRRATTAQTVSVTPDLRSEEVLADQLPEEGWLRLASEMVECGEMRLALRASFLAGLAHLQQREFISVARHKSNSDYDRELRRRARTRAPLLAAFGENLAAFERSWYGQHAVTRETLGGFQQNLETIRAC